MALCFANSVSDLGPEMLLGYWGIFQVTPPPTMFHLRGLKRQTHTMSQRVAAHGEKWGKNAPRGHKLALRSLKTRFTDLSLSVDVRTNISTIMQPWTW